MNPFKRPSLQLIAPTLVKLLKPTEIQMAQYVVGDVVALEKESAIALVRAHGAENAPAGAEAKNPYTVVDVKGKAVPESKAEEAAPVAAADLRAADKAETEVTPVKANK